MAETPSVLLNEAPATTTTPTTAGQHPGPGDTPAPDPALSASLVRGNDADTGGTVEGPANAPLGTLVSEFGDTYVPPTRSPIVHLEKAVKRARRKAGEPTGKPGKPSWVWGTKLTFFTARKNEWLVASQNNGSGGFYTKAAKLFAVKYGFELEDNEDFEFDVADPPDWVANKVVNERLSPEETAFRQKTHAKLRDRIGAWYRTQYASLLKEDKAVFTEMFGRLAHDKDKPPKRPQLLHFYSSRVYDKLIAPRVEKRMKELETKAKYTGGEMPWPITVQNQVTKECWEEETEVEQEETKRALEREHEIAVKAWKESRADGPNRTAEEFHASQKSAAHYLQPFVDTIAEHMGMTVSLLMAGPIGTQKGAIGMRSVHSGKTKGLVPKDWPLHNPAGFTQVEASMVDFARHAFTQAECEARVTAHQDDDAQDVPGTSTHTAASATARTIAAASATARGIATDEGAAGARAGGSIASTGGRAGPSPGPRSTERPGTTMGASGEGAGASGEGAQGGDGVQDDGGNGAPNGGAAAEEVGGEEADVAAQIERLWVRKDGAKWTGELRRAHRAFERGRAWGGIEWAACVDIFFDFEAAWGYVDAGGQITTRARPAAVEWWLGRGRNWDKTPDLGALGNSKTQETFVAEWWTWWLGVQPEEEGDWTPLLRLHGRNGLLQLMATLLWWGETAEKKTPMDQLEWSAGVDDVTRVLTELLRPGVIEKAKKQAPKDGKGKERVGAAKRKATEVTRRGEDEVQMRLKGVVLERGDAGGEGRRKKGNGDAGVTSPPQQRPQLPSLAQRARANGTIRTPPVRQQRLPPVSSSMPFGLNKSRPSRRKTTIVLRELGNGGLLVNSFPRSLRVHPSPPVPSSPSYPYLLSPSFPASCPPPHNAVRALESRLHGRQRGLILRLAFTTTNDVGACASPHAGAVCVHVESPPSCPRSRCAHAPSPPPLPARTLSLRTPLPSRLPPPPYMQPPSLPFLLVVPIPIHTACTRRSLQSNLISQTTLPCAILVSSPHN
ncbi:hypothetical protein B0H16DRAFT_1758051 [Mycena metata]|uniref:Uncharacterized protein n=1 Tax=Mycena metata TaxID=1033252 RepID=A0AAD7N1K9_9AGAR|nr:hypothetical protein B0H16DRAFT_1758051 [Mycena metata]